LSLLLKAMADMMFGGLRKDDYDSNGQTGLYQHKVNRVLYATRIKRIVQGDKQVLLLLKGMMIEAYHLLFFLYLFFLGVSSFL
jgi:hypothetical protein